MGKPAECLDPPPEGCGAGSRGDLLAREIENMERFGWFIHYVPDDSASPYETNIHTHGLETSFGHPDLQFTCPIGPETAQDLFNVLVERIRRGEKFRHGQVVRDLLSSGMPVALVRATESGRRVLRLVLPDPRGRVHPSEMNVLWAFQWDGAADSTFARKA